MTGTPARGLPFESVTVTVYSVPSPWTMIMSSADRIARGLLTITEDNKNVGA